MLMNLQTQHAASDAWKKIDDDVIPSSFIFQHYQLQLAHSVACFRKLESGFVFKLCAYI